MDGAPTRRARSPTHHDTAFATRPSKHPRLHTNNARNDSPDRVEPHSPESQDILDALEEELTCGMCSGVFIEPVELDKCGHVFCGSCVTLWLKNRCGQELPLSCPQCRISPIGSASPSRLARIMVSLLVSRKPKACRALNERAQADLVYMSQRDGHIKFPKSKPDTPASSASFWQPCQHCYPADATLWACPIPVARYSVLSERYRCTRADGVCPDGHRLCAGCDRLSPSAGPTSALCVLCGEGFCGDSELHGCSCSLVTQSRPAPHWEPLPAAVDNANIEPLMLSFRDNWQELSDLAHYLRARPDLSATKLFQDITSWVSSEAALSAGGVFGMLARADSVLASRAAYAAEMQQVFSPDPSGKDTVCGSCLDEVFSAGLYEWWAREVVKPEALDKLPAAMRNRSHCDRGRTCDQQGDPAHTKRFTHSAKLPSSTSEAVSPGPDHQLGDKSPESSNVRSVDVGIQHGDSAFALGKATFHSGD